MSITGPVGQFPTGIVAATLQPSFADIPRVTGDAGNVSVSAQSISLTGGGSIATLTSGVGAGGSVGVSTPGNLLLDSGGQIAASATDPNSASAGQVTVLAGRLAIGGGAQIASTTAGKGIGGDVSVASPLTDLVGPGPQITARSTGSGDAGSIRLTALRLNLRGGASISTEAATANGGNISLTVVDFLYLRNSQITTSVKGSTGNGGNIAIDPKLLVLDHSQIIAQAVQGHGGNITIVADQFVPSADSLVSASSQLGISGTVELIGPRVDLNGSLVVLSSELYNAAAVLRDNCAARGSRPRSSLVERGRGGLPQDTEAAVPALYLIGRDVPQRQGSATPEALLPAVQTALRLRADCGR